MAETISNLWVCVDCAQVIANGDWGDLKGFPTDDNSCARVKEIEHGLSEGHWVLDGLSDENESATEESGYKVFSRSMCDCCRSNLGGSRLLAAII